MQFKIQRSIRLDILHEKVRTYLYRKVVHLEDFLCLSTHSFFHSELNLSLVSIFASGATS